jgi:hypothetical protein
MRSTPHAAHLGLRLRERRPGQIDAITAYTSYGVYLTGSSGGTLTNGAPQQHLDGLRAGERRRQHHGVAQPTLHANSLMASTPAASGSATTVTVKNSICPEGFAASIATPRAARRR